MFAQRAAIDKQVLASVKSVPLFSMDCLDKATAEQPVEGPSKSVEGP